MWVFLYTENYKTLQREIKDEPNKCRAVLPLWIRRLRLIICRISAVSIAVSVGLYVEIVGLCRTAKHTEKLKQLWKRTEGLT